MVVKRESTRHWGTRVDLFCSPYPNRYAMSSRWNGVDLRGDACRIVWRGALSRTGWDIICREMPCGKFERLAGCTIAPHGSAFEIRRAAQDCRNRIILDRRTLGAEVGGHISRGDAPRALETQIERHDQGRQQRSSRRYDSEQHRTFRTRRFRAHA